MFVLTEFDCNINHKNSDVIYLNFLLYFWINVLQIYDWKDEGLDRFLSPRDSFRLDSAKFEINIILIKNLDKVFWKSMIFLNKFGNEYKDWHPSTLIFFQNALYFLENCIKKTICDSFDTNLKFNLMNYILKTIFKLIYYDKVLNSKCNWKFVWKTYKMVLSKIW